jgi:hypothetical protein|nr:MAG TPA: DNA REPAIR HELICASE RAD25, SSL2, PRE-INITIATION COMPLEX, RNA POLYMERASE.0A [Caudoviricetes sp.]
MEVIKIIKKTYKVVYAVDKPFLKFGQFRATREYLGLSVQRNCFNCGRKFKDEDDIYLIILKGTLNKFFCQECNDKALSDLKKEDL